MDPQRTMVFSFAPLYNLLLTYLNETSINFLLSIVTHGHLFCFTTNSPPTLTGAGHQRTVSTSTGCDQCLSLANSIPIPGPSNILLNKLYCILLERKFHFLAPILWGIRLLK